MLIRDYGIKVGKLETGPRNTITDVSGVTVGHKTLQDRHIQTGVTAIIPHPGNIFAEKLVAATHVINGFGKSVGLVQIEELGTLETPILLTNTFSVGVASDTLIKYMLDKNPDIGRITGTINPVVGECNDGYLNDIRGGHITPDHVLSALANATEDFSQGAIGAGRGMSCYGLKGGIGSASRQFVLDEQTYTLGALVLTNFGELADLRLDGVAVGRKLTKLTSGCLEPDKGSVIVILGTDLPVSDRQLKRISRRAVVGLARTGSYIGHGSGDIVLAFSTANKIGHYESKAVISLKMLNEDKLNLPFRAAVEVVEEAVLNSLVSSETTYGRDGNKRHTLSEYLEQIWDGKDDGIE